jgi:hypothetical protein
MDPVVEDQVMLNGMEDSDVVIHWNQAGDRAGLIIKERVVLVLDFNQSIIFGDSIVPSVSATWARQKLEFSSELALEFGMDQFFKQPRLDQAIDTVAKDDTQKNRLLLYKDLLKGKLFVPITTSSPEDPNALIYTFPNSGDNLDVTGNLICAFTNMKMYNDQIGQYGLSYQKISADYLCYGARSFADILGITITSNSGKSILISRDEFNMLSLISQPQRMDTPTLLKELGNVFFDDVFDDNRKVVELFIKEQLADISIVRAGYYCQPKVNGAKPIFSLVVSSSNASEQLTNMVEKIQKSSFDVFCDCHVFSLSDIIAQSLEQAKTPLAFN